MHNVERSPRYCVGFQFLMYDAYLCKCIKNDLTGAREVVHSGSSRGERRMGEGD